jgi:hypothetical protein
MSSTANYSVSASPTKTDDQRATEDAFVDRPPPDNKETSSSFEQSLLCQLSFPELAPPLPPESCPLFCCFYAEFDNIVGPQVVHQSPPNFMNQSMDITFEQIHALLQKTFNNDGEENKTTQKTENEESIFDSTSDYVITGNELAGKMINLSTHRMHILTRPTVISDERYERNSLFFCVGFVLRRTEDPRPFRPVLSKWADTLLRLEVEDSFLTKHKSHLQTMLRALLLRLNAGECNLLLSNNQALHLKLFRPPQPLAPQVTDHAVPVLLRVDWQVQMFDWDLAINWIVNNIDGISNTKALSQKSEVDLEMVRACLRVLRHHNVVALVDMFFYSNRYEPTGKELEGRLLQEAVDFCKRRGVDDSEKSFIMIGYDLPRSATESSKVTKQKLMELYYSFDRTQTVAQVFLEKIQCSVDTASSSQQKNDWRQVLADLDHRRFVTFGVINGLIRRVHNYPFATVPGNGNKGGGGNRPFAYQIAHEMNGRTCDDALVCRFEQPIEDLIDIAREIGSVADIYST